MTLVELLRNGNIFKIANDECYYYYDMNYVGYSKQYDIKWTDKELLENVIILNGCLRFLKSLPELPNCTYLRCPNNKLESLPELPKCTYLNCSNNLLESLPE
jgi:Leucine-rich repeat (LRR) protein